MFCNNHNTDNSITSSETLHEKILMKKRAVVRASEFARDIMPEQRLWDMKTCGNILTFLRDEQGTERLELGFFCENRLCPACAWRKSIKWGNEIACILQKAVDEGYQLYFVTLTAKSVEGCELQDAVKDYLLAYSLMMKYKEIESCIAGGLRKIEITYNRTEGWYHPHIHAVWLTKTSPPSKGRITDIWRRCLRDKYAVNAAAQDVREVRSAERTDICEFAKYPAKSGDYTASKHTFETFYSALKGQRLLTYTGKARSYKSLYKIGALDQYKNPDMKTYIERTLWEWERGTERYQQRGSEKLEESIMLHKDEEGGEDDEDAPDH